MNDDLLLVVVAEIALEQQTHQVKETGIGCNAAETFPKITLEKTGR